MKKRKKILFIISNILLFLAGIIIVSTFWTTRHFAMPNIEQILFHLKTSVSGTDNLLIISGIKYFLFYLFTFLIFINFINKFIKKYNKRRMFIVYFVCSIIIFLTSFAYPYKTFDVSNYIENISGPDSKYISENYFPADQIKLTFPEKKKNLIVLYLESMESSYSSKKYGGLYEKNYIPNLTKLAINNLQFTNTNNIGGLKVINGTTWTTSAIVGINSGIPIKIDKIKPGLSANDYHFSFKNVYSLGDVLEDNGYNQELMMGSSINFGGLLEYYKAHGNYKIWDLNYAQKHDLVTKASSSYWGISDKALFEFSKKELTDLSGKDKPFMFSLMTMDTHAQDGYTSSDCKTQYKDKYANAIKCSDQHILEFLNWVKEQDFYENTTIVLLGDHYSMNTNFFKNIDTNQRTVYNVFINSSKEPEFKTKRIFTQLDMFPTILSSIGVTIPGNRLALGVDLFSGSKTLPEKEGFDNFFSEMNKKSNFYNSLY